jgi:tetratricopeptide (TPR) repeat protein
VSLNLGLAYKGLELYEQADAQFQRVLAEDPQDWDAVAERATLLKIKGEEGKAFELMETVPEGQGRMAERLEGDSDWAEAGDIDRLDKLRRRHGGEERGDTAVRRLMEMDQRRKDFEAANGAKTPPAGDAPQQ